jgi:hypothetical protein
MAGAWAPGAPPAHPHAPAAAQALLQRAQARHEARVRADAGPLRLHEAERAAQAPVLRRARARPARLAEGELTEPQRHVRIG